MIITGALSWFDEPAGQLRDCVAGLANVADRLVALDGPYYRYPHTAIRSPGDQHRALEDACAEYGLELTIVNISRAWRGQVEKRSHLLRWASHGSDWICVADADHIIRADRQAVRAELATVTADVVEVPFWTPANPARDLHESASGEWHARTAGITMLVPHLYRPLPGLHVERFHYFYKAWKGGEEVWLWADEGTQQVPRYRFGAPYSVEHRCLYREPAEVLANRAFCNDRDRLVELTGQEDHDPAVPVLHDYRRYSR